MNNLRISRLAGDLEIVQWSDEEDGLVYDPSSGETILLNVVERCALECLEPQGVAISFTMWVEQVAKELDASDVPQLSRYLESLSQQFEDVGLCHCRTS
jgi:hypothetical protein